ncbi:sulfotransferase family 2 domain-containing protein [Zhihengliuella flava]|uniref:Sulfotransferase family protein n=1 Tax=Zhihengliuella flava TaxID=1285193 RepID=A0A931DBJ5_9MICC|nr:sulfotransferase family 2 domain-containing protein [Zhihengliuella flava]MBG6085437.1 hypothetical protein [Zhihengliuella flava]
MPIFRKRGKAVLFAHVPKTGGTSVERLFRSSGWEISLLLEKNLDDKRHLNYYRRSSPQHMQASLLSERFRLEAFDVIFMMVRDPLERFRSEIAMRLPRITDPADPAFNSFGDQLLRDYIADPYAWDNHLRPQVDFYLPGASIFKLEEGMGTAVTSLREDLGLDLGKTAPHNKVRRSALKSSDIVLSPSLERRVVQLYAQDYTTFDYARPIITS